MYDEDVYLIKRELARQRQKRDLRAKGALNTEHKPKGIPAQRTAPTVIERRKRGVKQRNERWSSDIVMKTCACVNRANEKPDTSSSILINLYLLSWQLLAVQCTLNTAQGIWQTINVLIY